MAAMGEWVKDAALREMQEEIKGGSGMSQNMAEEMYKLCDKLVGEHHRIHILETGDDQYTVYARSGIEGYFFKISRELICDPKECDSHCQVDHSKLDKEGYAYDFDDGTAFDGFDNITEQEALNLLTGLHCSKLKLQVGNRK